MLVDEKVLVIWNSLNREHYISKGYIFTKIGEPLLVFTKDLIKGADRLVNYQCDNCGSIFKEMYINFPRRQKSGLPDLCGDCRQIARNGSHKLDNYLIQSLRNRISPWMTETRLHYKYRCVITGEPTNTVHHLVGFSYIARQVIDKLGYDYMRRKDYTREEYENISSLLLQKHYEYGLGVLLITPVHRKFHTIYGLKDDMRDEFKMFQKLYSNNCI